MTLREICKEKEITQQELGELTGIAQSTISQYFRGKRRPSYATAKKIANALGVTTEIVFDGLPDAPAEESPKGLLLEGNEGEDLTFQERVIVSCMRKLSAKAQDMLVQTALNIVRRDEEANKGKPR